MWLRRSARIGLRRSPYGERGLKSDDVALSTSWDEVALLTESVD